MKEESIKILAAMAARLSKDPDYMAHLLSLYRRQEGMNEQELARDLETSLAMLIRLALCKRPDSAALNFGGQVQRLADYTGIAAAKLSQMINEVEGNNLNPQPVTEDRLVQPWNWVSNVYRLRGALGGQAVPILTGALLVALIYTTLNWYQGASHSVPPPSKSEQRDTGSAEAAIQIPPAEVGKAKTPDDKPSEIEHRKSAKPVSVKNRKSSGPQTRSRGQVEDQTRAIATLVIDLDQYKTLRDGGSEAKKIIRLPQSRVRIRFRLPEGVGRGDYAVCIIDAFNNPLVTSRGWSANGKTLSVVLDATNLETKSYRLSISRAGKAPSFYSILVEKK